MGSLARRGFAPARAAGWRTARALPAILLQDGLVLFGGSATSFSPVDCAKALPFQIWCFGGAVVQSIFERNRQGRIGGHRRDTLMDNWLLYYAYTVAWVLAWAALIQTRDAVKPAWKDPLRLGVAAILLVNALAGASWPWWGT
ncbi:MAG: hypothetical protein IPK67_04170 [Planctomycetes bacterium]|nr:hypothetical protein [Planctomycetota bacterium]